jgi:hypothetical protein
MLGMSNAELALEIGQFALSWTGKYAEELGPTFKATFVNRIENVLNGIDVAKTFAEENPYEAMVATVFSLAAFATISAVAVPVGVAAVSYLTELGIVTSETAPEVTALVQAVTEFAVSEGYAKIVKAGFTVADDFGAFLDGIKPAANNVLAEDPLDYNATFDVPIDQTSTVTPEPTFEHWVAYTSDDQGDIATVEADQFTISPGDTASSYDASYTEPPRDPQSEGTASYLEVSYTDGGIVDLAGVPLISDGQVYGTGAYLDVTIEEDGTVELSGGGELSDPTALQSIGIGPDDTIQGQIWFDGPSATLIADDMRLAAGIDFAYTVYAGDSIIVPYLGANDVSVTYSDEATGFLYQSVALGETVQYEPGLAFQLSDSTLSRFFYVQFVSAGQSDEPVTDFVVTAVPGGGVELEALACLPRGRTS